MIGRRIRLAKAITRCGSLAVAVTLLSALADPTAADVVLVRRGVDRPFPLHFCPCETRGPRYTGGEIIKFTATGSEVDLVFEIPDPQDIYPTHGLLAVNVAIDNVALVTLADWNANSGPIPGYGDCFETQTGAPGLYLDEGGAHFFVDRITGSASGWTLSDCAQYSSGGAPTVVTHLSASGSDGCIVLTGSTPNPTLASARRRVTGLTPGTDYVLTYWWSVQNKGRLNVTVVTPGPPAAMTPGWMSFQPCPIAEVRPVQSLAWTDWSGDGLPDLAIGTSGTVGPYDSESNLLSTSAGNALIRNLGGGSFVGVSAFAIKPQFLGGMSWADFDNDGDEDVLVSGLGTTLYAEPYQMEDASILRNEGGGATVQTWSSSIGGQNAGAWADIDRDGRLDFLVPGRYGNKMFLQSPPGSFVYATPPALDFGYSSYGTPDIVSWTDIEGDGDMDLVMNGEGRLTRYLNLGGGSFGAGALLDGAISPASGSTDIAWGDYDNDGDLDLFIVADDCLVGNRLLRNLGGGIFVDATPTALSCLCTGGDAEWADVDQDGRLDLLLAMTRGGGGLLFYRNLGDGTNFTDATPAGWLQLPPIRSVAVADPDGDGDLDLALGPVGDDSAYTAPFDPVRLMLNQQTTGRHWLKVRLRGTTSNRDAIGARITIVAGGLTQTREVTAGLGQRSQSDRVAHFGLGSATLIDQLTVRWPNGAVQTLNSFPGDFLLQIVEGAAIVDVPLNSDLPKSFALAPLAPNPTGGRTVVGYALPRPGVVTLRIVDLAGRTIQHWERVHETAGRFSIEWDGREEGGRPARSGIYFCRMQAPGFIGTRSIIVTR